MSAALLPRPWRDERRGSCTRRSSGRRRTIWRTARSTRAPSERLEPVQLFGEFGPKSVDVAGRLAPHFVVCGQRIDAGLGRELLGGREEPIFLHHGVESSARLCRHRCAPGEDRQTPQAAGFVACRPVTPLGLFAPRSVKSLASVVAPPRCAGSERILESRSAVTECQRADTPRFAVSRGPSWVCVDRVFRRSLEGGGRAALHCRNSDQAPPGQDPPEKNSPIAEYRICFASRFTTAVSNGNCRTRPGRWNSAA